MTKNTTMKTKAKQQKAVSRAVKQAGFKNIKDAKETLRKVKKEKVTGTQACCVNDDCSKVSLSSMHDRLFKLEQELYKKEDCADKTSWATSACSQGDSTYSANKSDWSLDNILAYRSWSAEDNAYYLNIRIKL
jgi:hypothetical protein